MKKTSVTITMLAVSILLIFCVHIAVIQLVFVAAAAFFCYRLSEQFIESRKEEREKDFLRAEEVLQVWQDRLTASLNEMTRQMAGREEQLGRLLEDMSARNTEQTERCVQMIEQLAKDGEEMLGRLAANGEDMTRRLVSNGEEMTGRLVSNGEEMTGRLVSNGEEMTRRLVSNGEEMAGRLVSNGEEMASRLVSNGEEMAGRLVNNGEVMAERLLKNGEEMAGRLMTIGEGMAERLAAALEKEEGFCASVEEQVRTIRTISEINTKKLLELTESHYQNMSELFDDQNDNTAESLKNLKQGQMKVLEENCKAVEQQIEGLREAVRAGIQPVLDQNQELLAYIQQVQKEWTELDKQELKFLDKVWRER